MVLAANVSRLRHEKGFTQKELGIRAGMSQPRIAEIERGDGNPELKTLIRIARALDVDLSTLHSTQPDVASQKCSSKAYSVVFETAVAWDEVWGQPDASAFAHGTAANDLFALNA